MTDKDETIKKLTKGLKSTGLGSPKKQMNFEKVSIELKDDFKTNQITATIKMFKRDGDITFDQMSDIQKMAAVCTWAMTDTQMFQFMLQKFSEAHSKAPEGVEVH